MLERPHLAFPVELTSGGQLLAVEQDADREIADCIAVILNWPQGTRQGLPEFGTPVELFESGGADVRALHAAVSASEPRAGGLRERVVDAYMRGGVEKVLIAFDPSGTE